MERGGFISGDGSEEEDRLMGRMVVYKDMCEGWKRGG